MDLAKACWRVFGSEHSWIPAGPALVYCYRRFGFTEYGSDSYKSVCRYNIPTDVDGLFVGLLFGGVTCFIGSPMTADVSEKYYRSGSQRFLNEYHRAFESALRDLLRPVRIRDVYVNILGECNDLGEWDEDKEIFADEVDRSFMAGYGVVTEVYKDFDLFLNYLDYARTMGDGDLHTGMKKVMEGEK